MVQFRQQGLAVSFAQPAGVDQLDRFFGQVEQPDRVHDVGSASESLCEHTSGDMQILERGRDV